MFKLLGVTLFQPEHVVSARLPGGAEAVGSFLGAIQALLRDRYDDNPASGARTLSIALGPQSRMQLWLAAEEEAISNDEQLQLRELSTQVSVPEVQGGPIALALVFSLGVDAPPEAQLTLPDEWRGIMQASDTTISVEQIITRLWASAN
jgi:hypothetical protein